MNSWELELARKRNLKRILKKYHRSIRYQHNDFAYWNREKYRNKCPIYNSTMRWPLIYESSDAFNWDPSSTPSPRSRVPSYRQGLELTIMAGDSGWKSGANGGATEWDSTASGGNEWNNNAGASSEFNSTMVTGFDGVDQVVAGDDLTGDGATNDDVCRNCGQEGHFSRACPAPKKMGTCFNCGEEGHAKLDCSKPRVFNGKCRECDQEGHQARDCPSKPQFCKICKDEGHVALECKGKMKLDLNKIPDKTEDESWALLTQASEERDLDDFKNAVKILSKLKPDITYIELEEQFRKRGFSVYLIGLEKETGPTWTNVDLQGNTGKTFAIGYFFSEKPQRPSLKDKWPESIEINFERLADAGVPLDRGVELCNNCGEVGHSRRLCPQEAIPIEQVTISCKLCGEEGHRVRDCTQERQMPRAPRTCKICESEEHIAKECPNREKRTCHKCGSEDHMAKECDIKKCTNCDAEGHEWRDCTAPKDWSRVKCRNCGEMGHTIKRCKQPIKEEENVGGASAGDNGFGVTDAAIISSGAGGDWDNPAISSGGTGQKGWESNAPTGAIGAGDSGW